jgi:hypothetical protein
MVPCSVDSDILPALVTALETTLDSSLTVSEATFAIGTTLPDASAVPLHARPSC